MGNINAILVAEKKVLLISFSGSISCLIVGRIAQFRLNKRYKASRGGYMVK